MKPLSLICLVALLSFHSQLALAAEAPLVAPTPVPQASPSSDPVTIYRLEARSPEFLTLTQVAYPLPMGYFLQDEMELGGIYAALQGSMLLAGTIWGPGMGGSSWTQLLPNLSLGLLLMSLAHVDSLARAKNAQLADKLGLTAEQRRRILGPNSLDTPVLALPALRWEAKLSAALLLESSGQLSLAPGPGLQLDYPLGSWLKVYTGESWLENLGLILDIQGFWPIWTTSLAPMAPVAPADGMPAGEASTEAKPGPGLMNSPGVSSSLGLVYRTPTAPWAWYAGGGWTTLWRNGLFAGAGPVQASWQGVSAMAGLSFGPSDGTTLNLGLQLGFLGFSGSSGETGMGEVSGLIRIQPEVSGSFVF